MKQPKVALLTPFGDRYNIPGSWVDTLIQLKWGEWPNLGICRMYGHDVARNRNNLVEAALDLPDEWFLWLDSDQTIPDGLIWRLLSWDKPIVAALVFKKEPDSGFLPVFYQDAKREADMFDSMLHPVLQYMMKHGGEEKHDKNGSILSPQDALIKCDAVGFGCVLTHRSVFEKVPIPWFSDYEGYGEDIAFCVKARKHGFEVYGDMGAVADHKFQVSVDHRVFINRYGEVWRAYERGEIPETDVEKFVAMSMNQRTDKEKTKWTKVMQQHVGGKE